MQVTRSLRQTANESGRRLRESFGTASTQISVQPSPQTPPEEPKDSPASKKVFPWKVIHACEQARDVLSVIECQLAVGMRPCLVTPTGFASGLNYVRHSVKAERQGVSLLRAWNEVRHWKRLLEDDSKHDAEVVHTHSFAAGMAGVRADLPVVYDLRLPIEQIAFEDKSWLRQSFHVAEQFVLSNAAAVVVHSNQLQEECLRRGIEDGNLFHIPEPMDPAWLESVPDRRWIEQRTGANSITTIFFVPELSAERLEDDRQIAMLVAALNFTRDETAKVKLILLEDGEAGTIHQKLQTQMVGDLVHLLPKAERDRILASCDVVITCDSRDGDSESQIVLETLARGRALLAAGRASGFALAPSSACLRYRPEEERELAYRMAFLARNPDVCRVLATNGRSHVVSTRSAQAIGSIYDEVYKHVAAKRGQRDTKSNDVRLIPLQVNL
jgi:glycosyltransferase involved in cell wall biosynthesis